MTVAAVVAFQSISNMCLDLVMLAGVKYMQGYATLVVTGLFTQLLLKKLLAYPPCHGNCGHLKWQPCS